MPGPANALNINEEGLVYFNGTNDFIGIPGINSGFILVDNGPGMPPSFQSSGSYSNINFISALTSTQSSITGDGTIYYPIFDTDITNVGSAYNPTTGIFTAPTNGSYLFNYQLYFSDLGAGHVNLNCGLALNGSLTGSFGEVGNPTAQSSGTEYCFTSTNILLLLAGDTVNVYLNISGSTLSVDLIGVPTSSGLYSSFSGTKIGSSSSSSGIITLDGNSGSATGSTVTVTTGSANANGTIKFTGSGSTLLFNASDAGNNTGIGTDSLKIISTGLANVAFGDNSLKSATSCISSVAIGYNSLNAYVGNGSNDSNIAIGPSSLNAMTQSHNHIGIGNFSLGSQTGGRYNIAIGLSSGSSYTTTESANICIGHNVVGIVGESNVIRIGINGSGDGQQDLCYIAGITGTMPIDANSPQVVVCDTAGNLTVVDDSTPNYVLTSNYPDAPTFKEMVTGITQIDLDVGNVTGSTITLSANISGGVGSDCGATVRFIENSFVNTIINMQVTDSIGNTFIGIQSGNTSVSGSQNTGFGSGSLNAITSGYANVSFGAESLNNLEDGYNNTGIGTGCLLACVDGFNNTSVGFSSLDSLISGNDNIALGLASLSSLVSGNSNIAIGSNSASNYNGSESNNIIIGNSGLLAESNSIRIGSGQSLCYISGITGATPVDANSPQVIVCDTDGNLTVVPDTTATYVLTSNAPDSPTFQPLPSAFSSINIQTFTSGGTYTPTSGCLYAYVQLCGGGGGGGGAATTTGLDRSAGSGGAGGGYSAKTIYSPTVQTVTIGAAGAGGTAGNNAGGNGGTTSFGSIFSATGGNGGSGGAIVVSPAYSVNVSSTTVGSGSGGDINISGGIGSILLIIPAVASISGSGGSSFFGTGGFATIIGSGTASNGHDGLSYGSAGSGGCTAGGLQAAGGDGVGGVCVITEYIG